MAQYLSEHIAGARVSLLDRCGHWSTVEKPAECNERLANFLQRL
jgi:pimeloyl-ACP methyl ester carboxylesterase